MGGLLLIATRISILDSILIGLISAILSLGFGIAGYSRGREKVFEARRRAEEANHSKSLFLANMSHEIRTPLGSLLGFAELLKDPTLSVRDRLRYAGIVERTGVDLLSIVNDILDLSKVEAEKLELEASTFSLRDFLDEIFSVLNLRCANKSIDLEFVATGFVPDAVVADALRLRQILMNLLGNAVKFTSSGKIRLEYQGR